MSGSAIFLPGNGVQKIETFTSSGTFNVPLGVAFVVVEAIGAGGGGGRTNNSGRGGGGGHAGIHLTRIVGVTPGGNITVTIGAAGVGRTGSLGLGGDGGDTLFGGIAYKGGAGGDHGTTSVIVNTYITAGSKGGAGATESPNTVAIGINGETLIGIGGAAGTSAGAVAAGGGGAGALSAGGAGAAGGGSNAGGAAAANSGAGGGGSALSGNGGNGGSGWLRVTWIELAE